MLFPHENTGNVTRPPRIDVIREFKSNSSSDDDESPCDISCYQMALAPFFEHSEAQTFDPSITCIELVFRIRAHPFFTRLRHVNQLGVLGLLENDVTYSRWTHSLQVGLFAHFVCRRFMHECPALGIEPWQLAAIEIGATVHDIGHGPYSHSFDEYIKSCGYDGVEYEHEHRSKTILWFILHELWQDPEVKEELGGMSELLWAIFKLACFVIDPRDDHPDRLLCPKALRYILSARDDNHMDIDRLDYIYRDNRILLGEDLPDQLQVLDGLRIDARSGELAFDPEHERICIGVRTRLHAVAYARLNQFDNILHSFYARARVNDVGSLETLADAQRFSSMTDKSIGAAGWFDRTVEPLTLHLTFDHSNNKSSK
jgi:hypothetical protein